MRSSPVRVYEVACMMYTYHVVMHYTASADT